MSTGSSLFAMYFENSIRERSSLSSVMRCISTSSTDLSPDIPCFHSVSVPPGPTAPYFMGISSSSLAAILSNSSAFPYSVAVSLSSPSVCASLMAKQSLSRP